VRAPWWALACWDWEGAELEFRRAHLGAQLIELVRARGELLAVLVALEMALALEGLSCLLRDARAPVRVLQLAAQRLQLRLVTTLIGSHRAPQLPLDLATAVRHVGDLAISPGSEPLELVSLAPLALAQLLHLGRPLAQRMHQHRDLLVALGCPRLGHSRLGLRTLGRFQSIALRRGRKARLRLERASALRRRVDAQPAVGERRMRCPELHGELALAVVACGELIRDYLLRGTCCTRGGFSGRRFLLGALLFGAQPLDQRVQPLDLVMEGLRQLREAAAHPLHGGGRESRPRADVVLRKGGHRRSHSRRCL